MWYSMFGGVSVNDNALTEKKENEHGKCEDK